MPADTPETIIPADDVILRGYCGPILWHDGDCDWLDAVYLGDDRIAAVDSAGGWSVVPRADVAELGFDCILAPVRDHIARVMAGGVACEGCPDCKPIPAIGESDGVRYLLSQGACADCGGRVSTIEDARRHDSGAACDEENEAYPDRAITIVYTCSGSGYLLPPTPIEHLMDRPGSRLTAAQSAVLVAWSYRSWRGGGAVLRDVMGPPIEPGRGMDRSYRRGLCAGFVIEVGDIYVSRHNCRKGWRIGIPVHEQMPGDIDIATGPETGPEGRTCADRAALAHNFALLNEDGSVTLPELPTETK